MLLCNPHNPTGRVWNKGELDELASICKDYNLMLVADEIHADFLKKGKECVSTLKIRTIDRMQFDYKNL